MKVVVGRVLGAAVVVIGGSSLIGWIVESESLTQLFVSLSTLKLNAAICLIALGVAAAAKPTP